MLASPPTNPVDYAIGFESATLLDLKLDVDSMHLGVKNPKGLITGLELRCSLSLLDGCGYDQLLDLSRELVVTCHCGHRAPQQINVAVEFVETNPLLTMDVGPYSMYMSDIQIRTRNGQTLRKLFDKVLNQTERSSYIVALAPISTRSLPNMEQHLRQLAQSGHSHTTTIAGSSESVVPVHDCGHE